MQSYSQKTGYEVTIGSDLKDWQYEFMLKFLLPRVKSTDRVLEIGLGRPRVLKALPVAEKWTADKFEGLTGGLSTPPKNDWLKVVLCYVGEDSQDKLPSNYFDWVFSISVLEHQNLLGRQSLCNEIGRILKFDGATIHAIDAACTSRVGWSTFNEILKYKEYFRVAGLVPLDSTMPDFSLETVMNDPDLWYLSEDFYITGWSKINMDYETFGRPISINLAYRKRSVSFL